MRKALWLLPVLVLVACATSPETAKKIQDVLDGLVKNGTLTPAQADIVLKALTAGGSGIDWTGILNSAIQIALAVAGSLLGVRFWRGPITNRKGLPPKG